MPKADPSVPDGLYRPSLTEPIGQLSPQRWMQAPETRAVIAALMADGVTVRFVGGCVRDSVQNRPISDIDIATPDPPERVLALLDDAGIRAIPTGLAHGTVTAVIGEAHFEITTLRRDVATDGRHASVVFTDDWVADAARRDFTFNAMSADPQGRIYDPFNGLADLGAGRVCFVGNPVHRIEEDTLRLLRFFRFQAFYGRGAACDKSALAACRQLAPRLVDLSGERVASELLRLLGSDDPATILLVMQGVGVLSVILPEGEDVTRLRQLAWLERRGLVRSDIHPDPLRRLAALLGSDPVAARSVTARLKLSGVARDRLVAMAAPDSEIAPGLDSAARRRILRRLGSDLVRDLVLLAWARHRIGIVHADPVDTVGWIGLLDDAAAWVPVELPVKGRDLLALGAPAGPEIGRVLARLDGWWEERDYRPTRDECLEAARRAVAGSL
ncbi:CCA tRNA nucleotidyltransferase [Magnetospirillum molischianum]|uniref:tRNA nucleotidyltransferase/poly(A) polymerase n=1 Tax=Magnetospirillum molischianum DSM 120 TaxID=1150626 RepID=H8FX47_MAGML|nr:CCA tRNA nucleotidyltransferase [Magnetospirillum molischianum]CCG42935.1 tRNA nucleotidyltransferase/poly(A) polymerase [Magnetospirillum molischianum DSM 120]